MRRRSEEPEQEKTVTNLANRGVASDKYDDEMRDLGKA